MLRAQRSSARYFQRPDQDYAVLDPSRTSLTGLAGELSFAKESGEWLYGFEGSVLSPSFEMNDAGFQTIADLVALTLNGTKRWVEPTRFFRSANLNVTGSEWRNFGNLTLMRQLSVNAGGQTHGFRRLSLGVTRGFRVLDHRATRGGPAMVNPAQWSARASVNGDGRNRISGSFSANYTADEEGSRWVSLSPTVRGRGEGWFSWSLRPGVSWSQEAAFYVAQPEDAEASATFGRRYIFAELEQASIDLTARLDMAITPTMTLQVYAQPFVASGDYERFGALVAPRTFEFLRYGEGGSTIGQSGDTYTVDADGSGPAESAQFQNPDFRVRSFRSNVVLRWEYLPGSTLFLVWSQDRADRQVTDDFDGVRDLRRIFGEPMRNVFLVKASYWLDF